MTAATLLIDWVGGWVIDWLTMAVSFAVLPCLFGVSPGLATPALVVVVVVSVDHNGGGLKSFKCAVVDYVSV